MHLLLGGALNSYWVIRMDDFYTTHNIKSMGLRQNCQIKCWIFKNSYGRWLWPSKCILQLRKEQRLEGGLIQFSRATVVFQNSCGARVSTDAGHQSSLCSTVEGWHHHCSLGLEAWVSVILCYRLPSSKLR